MKWARALCSPVLLFVFNLAAPAFGSEDSILNAIRSGEVKLDSKIALPKEENAAPPVGGTAGG